MLLIYFVLIFGTIIVIHELGHLLAAKYFNVYCDEFAFGMGPKLISKKYKETTYSIRLLPIGGFVSMAGEADAMFDDTSVPFERTIKGIAKWKQIIVMLAGVFMNFALALLLFVSIYFINNQVQLPAKPVVSEVISNSAAELAGFKANDEIIKVIYPSGDVVVPKEFSEVSLYFQLFPEEEITMVVKRDGLEETLKVTPILDESSGRYLIGVTGEPGDVIKLSFFGSIKQGFKDFVQSSLLIIDGFKFILKGIGLNQLSGPVGIMDQTNQIMGQVNTFEQSALILMILIATFSVNLGVVNLFPLPMFDGGRVIITLFEIIFKKNINKRLENILMLGSFAILVGLIILTSYNDLSRIIMR